MTGLVPLILFGGWLSLIVSHTYQLAGWAKRWTSGLLVLLAMCPLGLWSLFFPPLFDFTAFVESADYEFRDASYAAEFAALNADHIVSVI